MIELIKGLQEKPGVHIELVLFKNLIEYSEIHEIGITVHIIERKPKHDPRTFTRLYRICKEFRPDVIHAWSSMTAIFAFPVVKLLNIKLVNGNIANAPNHLKIWNKDLFRAKLTFPYSDIIVGNSVAGLKAYNAPISKRICIHNGFDFNRTKKIENPQLVKERYKLRSKFIVGKVAAFADRKDYKTFVEAANLLIQAHEDISFFAIGDGPNMESIKNAVPPNAKDKVVFTGAITDVESVINIFDIGVLSTNDEVHREGVANAILEYMAMGKPVIATEGGGTDEIVIDGQTGFLIPPRSPAVLADRILELLLDPVKARQMGQLGRQRVRDHFGIEKMTCIYFEMYNKLIKVTN